MARSHLTLILPNFSALFANELNRAALPPYLAKLIQKSHFSADRSGLERYYLRLFTRDKAAERDLPAAQLRGGSGRSLCADPCYLHADRDQLLLFHQDLQLDLNEAETLANAIRPLLDEFSAELKVLEAQKWLLECKTKPVMTLSALDELHGRPVTEHLPQGSDASAWVRLWNEIQMLLFDLPLNQQREAAGKLPINSLWFWGAAELPENWQSWPHVSGQCREMDAFIRLSRSVMIEHVQSVSQIKANKAIHQLAELDWHYQWGEQLEVLEQQWFKPVWQQLRRWQIAELVILVPGWGRYRISPLQTWRCW